MARSLRRRMSRGVRTGALYLAVAAIVIVVLGPLVWAAISSISPQVELLEAPPHWLPHAPTLSGYLDLLHPTVSGLMPAVYAFRRSLGNTLVVSAVTTLVCLIVGSVAAYAFARLQFAAKRSIFNLVVFTQMLPTVALIIPLYILLIRLHLVDTLSGLVLVYASFTLPFVIWVMRGYFQTIPRELEDAARVDGCSRLGALTRVIVPVSAPGFVATGSFAFLGAWGEFLLPVVLTSTPRAEPLTVIISQFSGVYNIDYRLMTTAGVLAALPPVILALVFSERLISGLTEGGVKG
jgi:multiple sugar transport system permease protein